MIKYLFFFPIFFYLQRPCPSFAQVAADSVQTAIDSTTLGTQQGSILLDKETGDSVHGLNTNQNSLYRVSTRSRYNMPDSLRRVPQNQLDKYLLDPDYSYANDDAFWKKEVTRSPGPLFNILNSSGLWWGFVFLVTVLVLVIIAQLSKENSFNFFIRRVKRKNDSEELQIAALETDYDSAINICQMEGDYRLAVHYMYLRLILTFRKKSGTALLGSVTNSDITRSIENSQQASEFRWLATAYEYIFYGGITPQKEMFDLIKIKYENLIKKIND